MNNNSKKKQAAPRTRGPNQNVPRSKKAQQQNLSHQLRLSPCALAYARVQLDPFDASLKNNMPCIPDLLSVPSQKVSTLVRGGITVGTGGVGVLSVSPLNNTVEGILAASTTPAFSGGTVVPAFNSAGMQTHNDIRLPWPDTATKPKTRLVGCGVRIRYTGTELNRGGQIFGAVDPGFGTFTGNPVSEILTRPETVLHVVDRRWKTIAFRATDPEYTQYTEASYGLNKVGNNKIIFIIYGTPGNTFEFEIIRFFEAISSAVTGALSVTNVTKSDSDITGMSIIRDYASSILTSDAGQNALSGLQSYLKTAAISALSGIVPGTGPAINMLGWK